MHRSEQTIYGPRLAADLGDNPACDDSNEPDRRYEEARNEKRRCFNEPPAPAQPSTEEDNSEHHHAAPHHDPERKERYRNRRSLIWRKILEAFDLAVEPV